MSYYTQAGNKAAQKYVKNNLKRVPLAMQKPEYERLKEAADSLGLPVATFIKQAVSEKIERLDK